MNMNSLPTAELIIPTVMFLIFMLGASVLIRFMTQYYIEPAIAIIFSLILGFIGGACIVLFINGISPFLQGARVPFLAFIILWLLCSVLEIGGPEITGNVVIDALITGFCTAGIAVVMAAGCWKVLTDGTWANALKAWIIVALFLSVVIRAILWAFE